MTTPYNTRTIPTTNYDARTDINYLLVEDLWYLLQEDWFKILLENSYNINTLYITRPTI